MFAKLKTELSSELASQKLTLRQLKTGISVDLPEDILFPSGSAVLRDSGREVLAKVSRQLVDANYQIVVSGYTDNVPISGTLAQRFPTNWDLAAARATNVVRLLEENKVPGKKLVAASYGENDPVASNKTEAGRKKNRRIEIHLRPVVKE
ncbi:MAG: OmpA family protein [Chromatiales bacterium]|nr:OmpA family protein [Chromatiales bacterium]